MVDLLCAFHLGRVVRVVRGDGEGEGEGTAFVHAFVGVIVRMKLRMSSGFGKVVVIVLGRSRSLRSACSQYFVACNVYGDSFREETV